MLNQFNTNFFLQLASSRVGLLVFATLFVFCVPISGNIFAKLFNLISRKFIYQKESSTYSYTSSVLLNLLIFIPIGLLVWSTHNIVHDLIYELVVLLFALEFASIRKYAKQTSHALRSEHNNYAKQTIHPYVLREVNTLSPMGIAKAASESIPLNFVGGWYVPAFWFLILGADGALFSSLIVILNRAFNPKQTYYEQFGQINSLAYKVISLFPICLMMLSLQFGKRSPVALKYAFSSFASHPYWISGMIIGFMAGVANVSLGGPRIYDGIKYRYQKIGLKTEPAPVHIDLIYKRMRNSILVTLLFLIFAQVAWLIK